MRGRSSARDRSTPRRARSRSAPSASRPSPIAAIRPVAHQDVGRSGPGSARVDDLAPRAAAGSGSHPNSRPTRAPRCAAAAVEHHEHLAVGEEWRRADARTARRPCRSSTPPASAAARRPVRRLRRSPTRRSRCARSQVRPKSSLSAARMPRRVSTVRVDGQQPIAPERDRLAVLARQPGPDRHGPVATVRRSPRRCGRRCRRAAATSRVQNMLTRRPSSGCVSSRWSQ